MAKLAQDVRTLSSGDIEIIINQAKSKPNGIKCRFKSPGGLGTSALMTGAGVMGGKLLIFGSLNHKPGGREVLVQIPLSCISNQSGKIAQTPADGLIVKWPDEGYLLTMP